MIDATNEKVCMDADGKCWYHLDCTGGGVVCFQITVDPDDDDVGGWDDDHVPTTSGEPTTTDAPTTDSPTTDAPTTETPTTDAPTTETPTSAAPSTDAPTTDAPTTEAPTTVAPTTETPTTAASTKLKPTTDAPASGAPTTVAPTTNAPTSAAPSTVAPTTGAPTTEGAATTDAPTTEGAAAAAKRSSYVNIEDTECSLTCLNGGKCIKQIASCSDAGSKVVEVCDCNPDGPASDVCFFGATCAVKAVCGNSPLGCNFVRNLSR
jgi:hypothetical protein